MDAASNCRELSWEDQIAMTHAELQEQSHRLLAGSSAGDLGEGQDAPRGR